MAGPLPQRVMLDTLEPAAAQAAPSASVVTSPCPAPRLAGLLAAHLALAAALAAVVALRLDHVQPLAWLGTHQGPLPLLYWAAVAVWAVAVACTLGSGVRLALRAALGVGFAVHLWLLLVQLQALLLSQARFYDNRVYLFYFRAWLLLGALAAGWAAGWVGQRARMEAGGGRPGDEVGGLAALVWLGFAVVWAAGLIGLAWAGGWMGWAAALLSLAAAVGGWRSGLEPLRRVGAALGAWLERRGVRSTTAALWALGVVAFVLVLSANYSLVRQLGDRFPLGTDDGDKYDLFSWLMATGGLVDGQDPVATRWYFRPPGYLFLVAAIYRVAGHSYLAVGVVQAALAALLPALTYALARRLFGVREGLLAAFLITLSGTIVGIMFALSSEALFIPQTLGLCYALLRAREARRDVARAGWLCLAGVLLGWAYLTRPQVLGLVALSALWVAVFSRPRGATDSHSRPLVHVRLMRRAGDGALMALATVLTMAPALWHDYTVNGRVSLLTAGAYDAWISDNGINPLPTRLMALGFRAGDPLSVKAAVLWAHRGDAARIAAEELPRKAVRFFFGPWHGTADPFLLQRFSPYAQNLRWYGYALVLIGLVRCLLERRILAEKVLLLGYVAYTFAVIMIGALPLTRYRVPLDPFLLALLAGGACWLAAWCARATLGLRRSAHARP